MDSLYVTEINYNLESHRLALRELLSDYGKEMQARGDGGAPGLSASVKLRIVEEMKKRPTIHCVLAFADTAPAGLIVAIEGFSTFAALPLLNIHDVVVSPAFRGQGISKKLLKEAENIARRIGCCKLTLEVQENNQRARHLYEKNGFESYVLDPNMGKVLYMQKKLL